MIPIKEKGELVVTFTVSDEQTAFQHSVTAFVGEDHGSRLQMLQTKVQ